MGIIGVLFIIILYFWPACVASGKRNSGAIFALNLFLGWTFVGWVIALVWACCEEPELNIKIKDENKTQQLNQYDELERLANLKDKGIISEDEFNKKKKDILERK